MMWYLVGVACAVGICYIDGDEVSLKQTIEVVPLCLLGPILGIIIAVMWLEEQDVVVWKGRDKEVHNVSK